MNNICRIIDRAENPTHVKDAKETDAKSPAAALPEDHAPKTVLFPTNYY